MLAMSRLRQFVLWIMMFAVPFQGYAAAAMALCEPGQTGAMTASTPMADPHAAHGQGARVAGEHHHDVAKQPAADHVDASSGSTPDSFHKCGTCGACHATALVSELQLAVFQALPPAALTEPSFAMATLAPHVLDKPPRS